MAPWHSKSRRRVTTQDDAGASPDLDTLGATYGNLQLAQLVEQPPMGSGWTYELKFDGYRIAALKSGGETRLLSRSRVDWTAEFATIDDAIRMLKVRSCVLDGEVCALNADGASSFHLLQNRGPSTRLVYFVFDCLMVEGVDLRARPLEERRERLAQILPGGAAADPRLVLSSSVDADPKEVLRLACEAGMEGIVAKAAGSVYVPGRTRTWLKIKCAHRQEFAIVGWVPLRKTEPAVGSLVLAVNEGGKFQFAGNVGTGFTDAKRKALYELLRGDESASPTAENIPRFGGLVRFVRPRHVAEVSFAEWTDGSHLRHPSFQGLRSDKTPEECVRETPSGATPPERRAGRAAPRPPKKVARRRANGAAAETPSPPGPAVRKKRPT